MEWILILEIIGGIASAILVFMILTPLYINALVDDPNRPNKPYLFTYLPPGRIKIVIRGKDVVRYLMNWSGRRFMREDSNVPRGHDEFWGVDDKKGEDEPLIFSYRHITIYRRNNLGEIETDDRGKNIIEWWRVLLLVPIWQVILITWAIYVHALTGAYFVGLWPWQGLDIYEIQLWALKQHEDKSFTLHLLPEETTDHLRAREFIWYVLIPSAETKDRVPLRILLSLRLRVVNPQKARYGTDRWDQAINNAVNSVGTETVRTLPLDQVLTATTQTKRKVAAAIQSIGTKLPGEGPQGSLGMEKRYGICVDDAQVLDYQPNLDEKGIQALLEPWTAKQDRKGITERAAGTAKGRADVLKQTRDVLSDIKDPETRRMVQELYTQVETADKGQATVLFGGNSGVGERDMLAAIFERLNRLETGVS